MQRFFFLFLLALLLTTSARAQVMVAPTFLYIDGESRHGSFLIANKTDAVQEVAVAFQFGYAASDSLGNRRIVYDDAERAGIFSLSPWIQCFPKRFRLDPGGKQLVRLMVVRAPEGDQPVYWTRLLTTSQEQMPPGVDAQGRLSAQIDFVFKQTVPVVFRRAAARTGLTVAAPRVRADARDVEFVFPMEREGEAPFFGTEQLRVYDAEGTLRQEVRRPAEVYFAFASRFTVPRDELGKGPHTVELTLRPERSDVQRGRLPMMEPIIRRWALQFPAVYSSTQ